MSFNPYANNAMVKKGLVSPFLLDANSFIPDNLESALDLCKFLFYINPTYVQASKRVVSHFITDFDISDPHVSINEKRDWQTFYRDDLKLSLRLLEAGMDDACYGNAFLYIAFPFDRVLVDRRDGSYREWHLDQFLPEQIQFSLADMTYEVPDLRFPGRRVRLPFKDKRSMNRERIEIRRLDPARVTIVTSQFAGHKQFVWRMEETMVANVKRGLLAEVNATPIDMLYAIRSNQDWLFNDGQVYHMARPCISGISNYGWGLPPVLENYRSLHQLQVYRRIDEAIGQDFMIPYRIIAPAPQSSGSDASNMIHSTAWMQAISRLAEARKTDPTKILSLPFPVVMSQFSGDGQRLVPKDNLDWHTNNMLDGMGYPAELFHGTLNLPLAPVRIRFFERTHEHVAAAYRGFTRWTNQRILNHLNREMFTLELQAPDTADSLDNKGIEMQLASAGEISRETAYARIGVKDPIAEKTKRMKEDLKIETERQEQEKIFQQQTQAGSLNDALPQNQQGGDPSQGGPPPDAQSGAGPTPAGTGLTPLDSQSEAQALAEKWLSMPPRNKNKDMAAVKATKPQLYAYAKQIMDDMKAEGESQGRASVSQQAQGGQPPQ